MSTPRARRLGVLTHLWEAVVSEHPLYNDGTLNVSQPRHCWQGDYGSLQPTACSLSPSTSIWREKHSAESSEEITFMACFGEEQRGLILAIWLLDKN